MPFTLHLDNAFVGANAGLCEILGLQNNKAILIPQAGTIKQLTTYVPRRKCRILLELPCLQCGAGSIGNYNRL
jgi:hypothetical protein